MEFMDYLRALRVMPIPHARFCGCWMDLPHRRCDGANSLAAHTRSSISLPQRLMVSIQLSAIADMWEGYD
jgi:hypothetical protein